MDNVEIEVALFRAFAMTALSMDLNPNDARAAADIFRTGRLSSRLALMFDGLAAADAIPSEVGSASMAPNPDASVNRAQKTAKRVPSSAVTPGALFDDVKRKKINKDQLFNLLQQVDYQSFLNLPSDISMRQAIKEYHETISDDDWKFLVETLRGSSASDPYLVGLTGNRR